METSLPLLFIPVTYINTVHLIFLSLHCSVLCMCARDFGIFTMKDAVVCQEVPAVLWLSFPVHHPGAHGKRSCLCGWGKKRTG